jgi:hypothetical protein
LLAVEISSIPLITADRPGKLYIDDKEYPPVSQLPIREMLTAGDHKIRIEKYNCEGVLAWHPGMSREILLHLIPKPARLILDVAGPSTAMVEVSDVTNPKKHQPYETLGSILQRPEKAFHVNFFQEADGSYLFTKQVKVRLTDPDDIYDSVEQTVEVSAATDQVLKATMHPREHR